MPTLPAPNRFFAAACVLHAVLAGLLFFKAQPTIHMSDKHPVLITAEEQPPTPIVQAATVDEAQVQAELDRLEKEEAQKAADEKKRLAAEQKKLKEAQAAQEKEKKRLADLKKEVEQLKGQVDKQKKEAKRAEEEAQALKDKAKAAREAEEKRLAEQKKAEEQRLAEQKRKAEQEKALQEQLAKEQETRENARVLNASIQQIMQRVSSHWLKPIGIVSSLEAIVQVKVLPSGEVIQASVIHSSGDVAFDRSAETAVLKASPLPMPDVLSVREQLQDFTFTFRPESG